MTSTYLMRCTLVKESEVKYGTMSGSEDVYKVLKSIGLHEEADEYVYMICTNAKGEVIGLHEISHGNMTCAAISPRDVFKRALLNNACAIIVAHNHPSGVVTPSQEDIDVTRRLVEAGKVLDIKLTDHIIVGMDGYYSMHMEHDIEQMNFF